MKNQSILSVIKYFIMAFDMYNLFDNHVFHVSKHFQFDLVSKHFINVINKQKTKSNHIRISNVSFRKGKISKMILIYAIGTVYLD